MLQRTLTEARSARLCWYPSAAAVTVDVGAQLIAHVSDVHRCASPWSCPVCAPVVRQGRAEEIDQGVRAHLDAGGGVLFVTFTLPHHLGDSLSSRLALVADSTRWTLNGSPWARRRKALGYVGSIKAVEITYGERNGWHPHAHVLLLFDRPPTDAQRSDLERWLFERWNRRSLGAGFGQLSTVHGVDVRPVTSAGELGRYLTKVENGWSAGAELARGHLKKAGKGMTPFALLRQLAETGEARWAALWREYEAATFGRRAIVWSPGLRARLLGQEEAPSDDELAAAEGADDTLVRVLIEAASWRRSVAAGTVGLVLDDIEQGAAVLIGLAQLLGHSPPSLPRRSHATPPRPPAT